MVDKKGLTRTGEVKDPFVLSFCSDIIKTYIDKANKEDISKWSIKELVDFLEKTETDVCFSDFARKYKFEMAKSGQERNAKNYVLEHVRIHDSEIRIQDLCNAIDHLTNHGRGIF